MIKAHKIDALIGEVEIQSDLRPRGHSKVRIGALVEFLVNLLRYRFNLSGWHPQLPLPQVDPVDTAGSES